MLVICLACIGLSGCASKYGEQTAIVKSFPDCYEPIQTLRNEENRVAKTTVGGAVAGGILGAVIGGLTGGTRGAIAGAVAGGVAGGVGGYAYAVNKQSSDENARMARYMQDLNGDISGLNIATASARMSIQCYQQKFDMRLAQYKEKTITREELQTSYVEIKSGVDEAQRILGKVILTAQESDAKYQAAIDAEEKRAAPQPQPQSQPQRAPAEPKRYKQPQQQPVSQKPAAQQSTAQSGSLGEVKAQQASYQAGIADAQKAQREAEDFSARMAENMS